LNGAFAAQQANSIILIMCIHRGVSEEGRFGRKSWAASMRLSHKATFIFRSICSPGCIWGSTGGMKTCSMTERKILEPGGSETGRGIGIGGSGVWTGGTNIVTATDIDVETEEKIQSPHVAGKPEGRPKRECTVYVVTESSPGGSVFVWANYYTVQCEALIQ